MKVYVAAWQYPGEEIEISACLSEETAISLLEEEIDEWALPGFKGMGFEPQEYESLLAGDELGFPIDYSDDPIEYFYVSLKVQEAIP